MKFQELSTSRRAVVERQLSSSPYRAVGVLGRGGMSDVLLVEHRSLGRWFALKLIHADYARQPIFVDRLRLEARALGRLTHPNIVEIVDLWFADDGTPCLVLELLEGHTLAQELRARRRLPVDEALRWARQTLAALDATHALDIVHRDVKPDNLFLHEGQERDRVLKLLDLGLARVVSDPKNTHGLSPPGYRTTTGTLVGSPQYMSPEALRGERVDRRADLYCVGLVLYEMLAGYGPFDAAPCTPIPPSRLRPDVPSWLDDVVLRALDTRLSARFSSAAEFSVQLTNQSSAS